LESVDLAEDRPGGEMIEPLYEERRTTPDSPDFPIWGKRQGKFFFPWMTTSHEALLFGWSLDHCGPNVSPDGSVLIPEEYVSLSPGICQYLDSLVKEFSERLEKTINEIIKNADTSF